MIVNSICIVSWPVQCDSLGEQMELLRFKYVPISEHSYRVYSSDVYLGKLTYRNDGMWVSDKTIDRGRLFKSRRAAAMRLFHLSLPLNNRLT